MYLVSTNRQHRRKKKARTTVNTILDGKPRGVGATEHRRYGHPKLHFNGMFRVFFNVVRKLTLINSS